MDYKNWAERMGKVQEEDYKNRGENTRQYPVFNQRRKVWVRVVS